MPIKVEDAIQRLHERLARQGSTGVATGATAPPPQRQPMPAQDARQKLAATTAQRQAGTYQSPTGVAAQGGLGSSYKPAFDLNPLDSSAGTTGLWGPSTSSEPRIALMRLQDALNTSDRTRTRDRKQVTAQATGILDKAVANRAQYDLTMQQGKARADLEAYSQKLAIAGQYKQLEAGAETERIEGESQQYLDAYDPQTQVQGEYADEYRRMIQDVINSPGSASEKRKQIEAIDKAHREGTQPKSVERKMAAEKEQEGKAEKAREKDEAHKAKLTANRNKRFETRISDIDKQLTELENDKDTLETARRTIETKRAGYVEPKDMLLDADARHQRQIERIDKKIGDLRARKASLREKKQEEPEYAELVPDDKSKLIAGRVYINQNGEKARWTGKEFEIIQ